MTDQHNDDALRENAPELVNREQDDGDQAQDIAAEALAEDEDDLIGDSEHGGRKDPGELGADDGQDVVDLMEAMVSDGRIDMGAYRGERNDDDEPDMLGPEGLEDGDIDMAGDSGSNLRVSPSSIGED